MGKLINSNKGSIRSFPVGGRLAPLPYGGRDDLGTPGGWWWSGPTGSRARGGPVSRPQSMANLKNQNAGGKLNQSNVMHEGGAVKLTSKLKSMNSGGVIKPVLKPSSRPVKRSMANGGAAKTKPASRSGCCRGKGGRVAPKPASRSAPLRGGGRSRGVR